MQAPLLKTFHYQSSIGKVWSVLTEPAKMRSWYFPQLQQFEPVVGYTFEFDDDHALFRKEWIVTQVINDKRLAHSWSYEGYAGYSEVIFDLYPEGGGTMLTVTQTGLDSFPDEAHFKRERFERGWDTLLGQNLPRLLDGSTT